MTKLYLYYHSQVNPAHFKSHLKKVNDHLILVHQGVKAWAYVEEWYPGKYVLIIEHKWSLLPKLLFSGYKFRLGLWLGWESFGLSGTDHGGTP